MGAGAIASVLTGRPLILEINGPTYSFLSLKLAKAITAYSSSMVKGSATGKLVLVDAGVNPTLFKPDEVSRVKLRELYGLQNSSVIGYVGTFQSWHGVDDLVRAAAIVLESHPNARFLMVGPNFESTMRLTESLGVSNAFIFIGPVSYERVYEYVNAADILVSPTNPSRAEWTKRAGPPEQFKVFEYMACRKAVIISASGPMKRINGDGENGLLFPTGDTQALAAAISRLIEDPALLDSVANRAHDEVVARFTWRRHAQRLYGMMVKATAGST